MRLFFLFLIVPIIEIALFIQVGGLIGLLPTLAIVILTAFAGSFLIRSQGSAVLAQLQTRMAELDDPTEPLAHGAMVLFAGALLLTPGFFTDVVGLSLMIPNVRNRVFLFVKNRASTGTFSYGSEGFSDSSVLEGEFEDLEQPKGPSGWTQH